MIPEWVKPGVSFRYFEHLYHIRAVVDGDQVVVREWRKSKQYWTYTALDETFFEVGACYIKVDK